MEMPIVHQSSASSPENPERVQLSDLIGKPFAREQLCRHLENCSPRPRIFMNGLVTHGEESAVLRTRSDLGSHVVLKRHEGGDNFFRIESASVGI